ALKSANWPRAPFILGFVLAKMGEGAYFITTSIWGWSALLRPIALALLTILVAWLIFALRRRSPFRLAGTRRSTLAMGVALIVFFGVAIVMSLDMPVQSGFVPFVVSATGAALCVAIAVAALRPAPATTESDRIDNVALSGLFLALTPLIGL